MRLNGLVFPAAAVVAVVLMAGCSTGYGKPDKAESQLRFGVDMARRGLWSEALFRFRQAERLDPRNPRIFNNIAVATEAMGDFDGARDYYDKALRLDPGNAELKRNYARFVEFYNNYNAGRGGTSGDGEGSAAEAPPGQSATGDG